ncbi:DUF6351 family protein [Streptomyces sp. M19]
MRRAAEAQRYDPQTNPRGARCDLYDHTVNVYGTDPTTGFARRPLDNVGVQYGLGALKDGTINKEQFLELNERIGGFDQDAKSVERRTVADLDATSRAYRTGRLTNGGADWPTCRSSTTARTPTTPARATPTCGTTPSRRASGWRRRTGRPPTW